MNTLRRIAPYGLVVGVALLSAFGLAMLYSTTAHTRGEFFLTRQVIWIVVGMAGALVINVVGYRRLGRMSHLLLGGVALALLYLAAAHVAEIVGVPTSILGKLPLVGSGATKGAWRWFRAGPVSIQPSEFAKLAVILFLAHYYSRNPRYVDSFSRGLIWPMLAVGSVLVLVLLGGSLSITAITAAVVGGMLMVAGVRLRYFLLLLVGALGMLYVVLQVSPERMERLTSYRNPEAVKEAAGYQLHLSQLALASGSWLGVGYNRSHMKESYLPEAHTDFILAVAGEELGYLGLLGVIVLYLLVMGSALAIAITAADREGVLIGFGLGLSLGLHAFANLGVVSGFLPTTGVTAPLVSYGGSSMLATWLGLGLLLAIARTAHREGALDEEQPESARPEPVLVRLGD